MSEWIEWAGGECPVPPDTVVEVVRGYWQEGLIISVISAKYVNWKTDPSLYSCGVVRYRIYPIFAEMREALAVAKDSLTRIAIPWDGASKIAQQALEKITELERK